MANLLIAVEITNQEADIFRKMRETGCFDIKDGSCTLHFGKNGNLLKLDKHLYTGFDKVAQTNTRDIVSL